MTKVNYVIDHTSVEAFRKSRCHRRVWIFSLCKMSLHGDETKPSGRRPEHLGLCY